MGGPINIFFLIDDQAGFEKDNLSQAEGGCLYVPGGQDISEKSANLMRYLKNDIIVLSQDFHPENHIGFMENHPGIMKLRRDRLLKRGASEDQLDASVLDVTQKPYDEILIKECEGIYKPVAYKFNGNMYDVKLDDGGYIADVRTTGADLRATNGSFSQTLWRKHCTKDSRSTLFSAHVMAELPAYLSERIKSNPSPLLSADGPNDNQFHIVRKGMRRDLDSYGIATENNGKGTTAAPELFQKMAKDLEKRSVQSVSIYLGGLATNFCVEFSHNDIYKYLVPALQSRGIETRVILLKDICRGIPLSIPGGAWPDLDNSMARMQALGTQIATTKDVMRIKIRSNVMHGYASELKS